MSRHLDRPPRKHRVIKTVPISLAAVLVVALTGGFFVYRHLDGNIDSHRRRPTASARTGPTRSSEEDVEHKPLNILLLGSDTREGQAGHIGGDTPGLSDTTILLHLSARPEAGVRRQPAARRDGGAARAASARTARAPTRVGSSMFNAAYAVGGPACTIKTVEELTDIRINHFVVIDFNGFKKHGRRPRRRRRSACPRRSTTTSARSTCRPAPTT